MKKTFFNLGDWCHLLMTFAIVWTKISLNWSMQRPLSKAFAKAIIIKSVVPWKPEVRPASMLHVSKAKSLFINYIAYKYDQVYAPKFCNRNM